MIAHTVSLNGCSITLSPADNALVAQATDLRLIDLNDGLGVDLQAFIPRLGGWTNIVTFSEAA